MEKKEKYVWAKQFNNPRILFQIITVIAALTALLIFSKDPNMKKLIGNTGALAIVITGGLLTVTFSLLGYLNKPVENIGRTLAEKKDVLVESKRIDAEIERLMRQMEADAKLANHTLEGAAQVIRNVKPTAKKSIKATEFAETEQQKHLQAISSALKALMRRNQDEVIRLNRSANLNLVFGIMITLLSVTVLAFEVFTKEIHFDKPLELLAHYIPRISIVILAEVFAFFFLRVYKTALNDIKYYQNEMTNIEVKFTALISAIYAKQDLSSLHTEMMRTERNIILKKGETTVELEREKIELEANKDWIEMGKSVLGETLGKLKERTGK